MLYFTAKRGKEKSPWSQRAVKPGGDTENQSESDKNNTGGIGRLWGKKRVRAFILAWERG